MRRRLLIGSAVVTSAIALAVTAAVLISILPGAGSPPRPVPHCQQLSKLSSDASLHLGQFHMVV